VARTSTPGIVTRHSRGCQTRHDGRCNCTPAYEAWVYSKREGKKIRRSFPTLAAARSWRTDALKQVKDRRLRAPSPRTLREEVDEWLDGARAGRILNKRERPYKPAVLRNYEAALRLRVLPALGNRRLADVGLGDLLELKEQLLGDGCSGSTIRNTFVPLQALYRRARLQERVAVDPTTDLPLPTANRRDRAATPQAASELLEILPEPARAIWVAAFYSGLRRGELRALRCGDVALAETAVEGEMWPPHLRVERGWDDKEGPIAPKSIAGNRKVFVLDVLRPHLARLVDGRADEELVFGRVVTPLDARSVARKAARACDAADKRRAEKGLAPLERFGLHEARHSFSTWLDHAGISESRADRYMGHALSTTPRGYRHLLARQLVEDRERVEAYLAGATAGNVIATDVAGPAPDVALTH